MITATTTRIPAATPGRQLLLCFMLAGCPADTPLQPSATDADDESSTSTPSSAPTEPTSTDATEPSPTGTSTDPDPTVAATDPDPTTDTSVPETTTSTGDTTSTTAVDDTTGTSNTDTTTGTSDTDTTTGGVDCEPTWQVPDVPPDALAAHDLAWIGCEFTACGPGESGLQCAPFAAADAPLEYLGHMHVNDTGVFTTPDVVGPNNFSWLDGPRHVYKYDDTVFILTEADGPEDQLDVFFTVRAFEVLRTAHPDAHATVLVEPHEFPAAAPLDGFGWKNRTRGVVVSFDTSPLYIAAGLTVLDADPATNMRTNLDEYSNVVAVSIDRETILGTSDSVGSGPIYGAAEPDENFLRYLREGLPETLVHELLHTRIDRLNSVDPDMQLLYDRRSKPNLCGSFMLEETLVAATSLLFFREHAGISDTYVGYYEGVLDYNLGILSGCPDYASSWVDKFTIPSGVDPRYDLRLLDLE